MPAMDWQERGSRDGIAKTAKGQDYAVKWPKELARQIPAPEATQSLLQTFEWPVKAKKNLEKILEETKAAGHRPLIAESVRLSLTSFFSGICSSSRGSQIIEAHEYGNIKFHHTSFVEKTKQGQKCLARDFPRSCVFLDQMHCLAPKWRLKIEDAKTSHEVQNLLHEAQFAKRAFCCGHGAFCRFECGDCALFGAPCVDDSPAGKSKQDEGNARSATCHKFTHVYLHI